MRTICAVTGSRAEYGLLKPVMNHIQEHEALRLVVLATGMHLLKENGYTFNEVKRDFPHAEPLDISLENDLPLTQVKSLGIGIQKLVERFQVIAPDIVLVLGDRNEALAAAIAASEMNIIVAHVHGGDITNSGTIDEGIRYAISSFAHIHFPVTERSKKRLLKTGEEEQRIFMCGSPAVDNIKQLRMIEKEALLKKYGLNNSFGSEVGYVVVLHNPVTIDPEESVEEVRTILNVLERKSFHKLVIYPNADPGSRKMIKVIESYRSKERFTLYRNIRHNEYLMLLKHARFLIGNSTSGIIEAPTLGTPVINVGERQTGREYFGDIRFVNADTNAINEEIENILRTRRRSEEILNPYGDGEASKRIAGILASITLDHQLIKKKRLLLDG